MTTAKECRHNAEICLKLARETSEIYAKMALIELAKEFRAVANRLEHSMRRPTNSQESLPSTDRARRS